MPTHFQWDGHKNIWGKSLKYWEKENKNEIK
jgi:hypothetical protein